MPPDQPSRSFAPGSSASNWLMHQVAFKALSHVAARLAPVSIPVVPTKGVALGQWLYERTEDRPLRDVDLLVPRSAFSVCLGVARDCGELRYVTEELGEITVDVDGFPVEFHAEFGRRELTDLSIADVIRRARPARLDGLAVLRIDDVD